ncbi:MAG: hypothetical protein IJP03_05320 [Christensenellaceae bacterium]|nr:hypothetical protein [Christensenellaceae bacterium]
MKKYLLPPDGNFYKANLHCHSVLTDGTLTPEELKAVYKEKGYSVLAYTDHDLLIPHDELSEPDFLVLHGFEMEIEEDGPRHPREKKCCHLCFIALEPDNLTQPMWHRSQYFIKNAVHHKDKVRFDETLPDYTRHYSAEGLNEIIATGREKGFFVTYNHPTWSLQDYTDYMSYENLNAFEMFNGACLAMGYDDINGRVYDDMLRGGKRIFAIGADDNHNRFPADSPRWDSGLAWTMIKAENLDYRTITAALERGDFYASQGPEIFGLWYEDGQVHVECSPAERVFCTYGIRTNEVEFAENGIGVTHAAFNMPSDRVWMRITVVDEKGRRACTNAYYVEEMEG